MFVCKDFSCEDPPKRLFGKPTWISRGLSRYCIARSRLVRAIAGKGVALFTSYNKISCRHCEF